jgi:hypothetical protein
MAEITTAGYQDIRDHIEATWIYVEFLDNSDDVILRLPLSDDRVDWTHAPSARTLELTTVITGSDVDITLPQDFRKSSIYKVATAGDALSLESFTIFTIEAESDQLTIKHRIEVPKI